MKMPRFVLYMFVLSSVSLGSHHFAIAQLEEIQTKQPNVVSGQLFTLRVVPMGKKIQIYVVGNKVSDIQFEQMNLKATMTLGNKVWTLTPSREQSSFMLQQPAELPTGAQPELNLKVRYKEQTEKFDLKIDSKK